MSASGPSLKRSPPTWKAIPCVTYLGPGSAGHYVKMVHNGIEYGLMQLIAESYDLMKRGLGLSDKELAACLHDWNKAELNAYLMEITSRHFHVRSMNEPENS